jgi:hypothetical protein
MPLTQVSPALLDTQAQYTGFKNRITNGGMRIDQRNAGASVTPTDTAYGLDRWSFRLTQSSKFTTQQNAGGVTPPTGFTNYLGVTSSSSYAVGTSDFFTLVQYIEGYNLSDLAWGTASAQPATLSFLVRSSLTGTFGGSFNNTNNTRSYPFTFSINAANTWELKTIVVPGDTSGTWDTTTGRGVGVRFNLGAGSTYSGTAGSWSGSTFFSATGAVSVVGTNGATFYITGVQLEKGSTATSFDYRPYGTELQLCQRYFYNLTNCAASAASTTKIELHYQHPVPMRGTPSLNVVGVMRIEDPSVAAYSQSSANSSIEQATYLGMKPGFGNFSGLTVARPYYVAAAAANVTASPPTGLCQVSAEL